MTDGVARELLSIENLHVRAGGDAHILRGINLNIAAGERVAILGRSGAGKTTLFRTIIGLVPTSSGRIVLDGTEITGLRGKSLRAQRCRIGFIAQKHDLVEPLRVHQNVMAGALGRWSTLRALRYLLRPTRGERDTAREVLSAVGLGHLLDAPTGRLSGGEQQRVAIARALVQAPSLLLADEPVASLDPARSHEILNLLVGVTITRSMALLCTLHQPHLASQYFERVVEIREGIVHEVCASAAGGSAVSVG